MSTLAQLDQSATLQAMRRGFEDRPSSGGQNQNMVVWAGATALLALLVMLVVLGTRWRRRKRGPRRVNYLARSAALVGVAGRELRDLRRLAQRAKLPQPAAMLLSPANLAHAVRSGAGDDVAVHERMNRLSLRLFGTPLTTARCRSS